MLVFPPHLCSFTEINYIIANFAMQENFSLKEARPWRVTMTSGLE